MAEHTVIIDSVGGATVMSCEPLQITNLEYPYSELSAEGVKQAILKHKFMSEENANFDLIIIDNRPESTNYNEQKAKESKIYKKDHNSLKTPK